MQDSTLAYYQERILKVLVHLQTHLDTALDRNDLARIAAFSPFHFSRIFKVLVGEGVAEHLRRLRLERAAGRLRFSRERVLDIALDAGFDSHEAFTRAFASHFGQSPSAYRASKGGRMFPEVASGVHFQTAPLRGFRPQRPLPDSRIQLEDQPVRHLAFVRGTGPYLEAGARAWATLLGWAQGKGLLGPASEYLGISHDDPEVTPPARIRYDAALTVPKGVAPEGPVGIRTLPGGPCARYRHEGALQDMGDGWWLLSAWLPASGFRIGEGISFEVYRTPISLPPPPRVVVDLYLGLQD